MKKTMILTAAAVLLCGCAGNSDAPSARPAEYTDYAEMIRTAETLPAWSVHAACTYTLQFSDDSRQVFILDEDLAAADNEGSTAHLTQEINSNGAVVHTDGWYTGDRLYNTYETLQYYEDMSFAQLKQSMLVPVDLMPVDETETETLNRTEDADALTYEFILTPAGRTRLFTARYDLYQLGTGKDYEVSSGTIRQTFRNGILAAEETDFTAAVTVSGEPVQASYHLEVRYEPLPEPLELPEDFAEMTAGYVPYEELDPGPADSEGDTPEEILQHRLVSRLGYAEESPGVYRTEFNTNEVYVIDFNTKQFIYNNRTSRYVYNWNGDTGGFGTSCNYDYVTRTGSSECKDSVIKTLEDVKTYFEMELYYCEMSLSDLKGE
ncbi:MAG: hypothetical protein IJL95_10880 [Solobacterium sp.]|nr:hypothetical protein [Solobacterium sp.]